MSNPNANVKTNQAFLSSGTTALRTWVSMAMLTAIAYVVMYVSKLLPQVFGFLQLDLKDTAICIGGFAFGPPPTSPLWWRWWKCLPSAIPVLSVAS